MINLESMAYDLLVLASMIGWLFETMQSNYHAATSHLNTTSRLMGEISRSKTSKTESTNDLLLQIRPSLILAEVYNRSVLTGNSIGRIILWLLSQQTCRETQVSDRWLMRDAGYRTA